MLTSNCKQKSN